MNRLNKIKILYSKNWKLNHNSLASPYKAVIGSILDYNFPCLNSFSKSGLQKLQVIQNTAVRCILKLPLRTSSESLFYTENKLNASKIDHRLSNLLENYLCNSLDYSVPLTKRLVSDVGNRLQSIDKIQKSTDFY
ncbi:RNA-directed DNA polymerase from mobile element jockey-like [Brachionus plicatilis]|uniref:RNA-directed DNA polymerase from mobile element jockey-like n=1 Tax=Brachionus plicatilis TaxID=10195 RepID=A0A3M7QC30_BRAPC|nr:RNA-directed DNA polymerase from mobile element jockey-like [Brachionus plicatilis]